MVSVRDLYFHVEEVMLSMEAFPCLPWPLFSFIHSIPSDFEFMWEMSIPEKKENVVILSGEGAERKIWEELDL